MAITFAWLQLVVVVLYQYIYHHLKQVFLRYYPFVERPIVLVRQGSVQGVTSQLPNGERYHYFKSIPYTKPPVGELRFQAPVPLERFDEPVLNCSYERPDFVQLQPLYQLHITGAEASLHLSVFTPGLPREGVSKYPVIVYIPGGAYRSCTSSTYIYDPVLMVQEGVVVVIVGYRVGPLGFLSLPDAGISGNAGLKDQRLALKWVHENIHSFRGDAGNVTLMGQSAGACSGYLHYLSPNSRKYFHRAILQSGDACTEYVFQLDPEAKARKLAKMLGCRGSTDREVLETLLKASASSLTRAQLRICSPGEQSCPMRFTFRPVIERPEVPDSIICQPPEQLLKSYDTLRMPLMSTLCSAEGTLGAHLSRNRMHKYNTQEEWLVPQFLGSSQKMDRPSIAKQVKQFYFGDRRIDKNTFGEFCNFVSDYTFTITSYLSAEWIARYQPNLTHYYGYFSHVGRLDLMNEVLRLTLQVAGHCSDLLYLFNAPFAPELAENCDEYRVREVVLKTVTNFAKCGNPTPDAGLLGFQWTPVAVNGQGSVGGDLATFDLDCLELNVPPRMIRNPDLDRREFWRRIMRENTDLL